MKTLLGLGRRLRGNKGSSNMLERVHEEGDENLGKRRDYKRWKGSSSPTASIEREKICRNFGGTRFSGLALARAQ